MMMEVVEVREAGHGAILDPRPTDCQLQV